MQYKLIMENWRKFLNEAPMQDSGSGAFTPRIPVTTKELDNLATMLTYIEPTGQISDITIGPGGAIDFRYTYEDVKDSVKSTKLNLEKGDYKAAGFDSALAVLGALAMIPVIGKVVKGARKAALAKRAVDKAAKSTSKSLRATGDPELIAKADEIDNAVAKASNEKATAVSGAAKAASKFFRSRLVRDHQGRLLVVMYTSKGPVVFLKSTGTSQIKILGFSDGKPMFASNDRTWVPIKGFSGGYQKFDSADVRFGKGAESNKQLYELVSGGDASEFMKDKHGFHWPRKIDVRELDRFDPRALEDLEKMYEKYPNEFYRIREGGKYPSPDSEFGRLSKHLQNLEDDNQLISNFGEIEQLELNDLFDWVNKNMGNI